MIVRSQHLHCGLVIVLGECWAFVLRLEQSSARRSETAEARPRKPTPAKAKAFRILKPAELSSIDSLNQMLERTGNLTAVCSDVMQAGR